MTMVLLCYARCYVTGQSEKVRVGARGLLVGVCVLILSSMQGGVHASTGLASSLDDTLASGGSEEQILTDILTEVFSEQTTKVDSVIINPDSIPGLLQEAIDLDAAAQIQLFTPRDVQFITLVKNYFNQTEEDLHKDGFSTLTTRMGAIEQSYWDRINVQGSILTSVFVFINEQLESDKEHGAAFATENYSIVYANGQAMFTQTSFKTVSMMNVYKNGTPMFVCDFTRCGTFSLQADQGDEFTLYMSSIHYGNEGTIKNISVR